MSQEQKYIVYQCEATGVSSGDGEADTVWYPNIEEAFEDVKNALDLLEDFGEGFSWQGTIGKIEATWEQIVDIWGEDVPNKSEFEKVNPT